MPKRLYDSAAPEKNLLGAVVKTEKKRYLYALNVV